MTQLLTIPETAERLRVSIRTVHKLVTLGHLRPTKIGRRTFFTDREIEAYLSAAYRGAA